MGVLNHGRRPPIWGEAGVRCVPEDVGGLLIDALSYFVVQLTPTVLVIGLAWTVFRAIGVSVIWKRDE